MAWQPPPSPSDGASIHSLDSVDMLSPSSQQHQQQQPHQPEQQQYTQYQYGGDETSSAGGTSAATTYYTSTTTSSSSHYDSSHLRRRNTNAHTNGLSNHRNSSHYGSDDKYAKAAFTRKVVQNLDMFPKIESDLTVRTERGGLVTIIGYCLVGVLVLAEWWNWSSGNNMTVEHVVVDTSLGKKMRVDLNLTFPALHCDDLHIDLMDVAGDVQINVEDTMKKRRLHLDGTYLNSQEIEVEANKAHKQEEKDREFREKMVSSDYCGPCYGAQAEVDQCCNSCDDVVNAYKKKSWAFEQVRKVAEQCVREGKTNPRKMLKGEGCEIAGYMAFNRVAGNFHIAMGEGVERNGRHIHAFLPEDSINFNASHIINELRFGPALEGGMSKSKKANSQRKQTNPLDGVRKIVKEEDGSTGLFQYFIKIVPTTYKGKDLIDSLGPEWAGYMMELEAEGGEEGEIRAPFQIETNRYFATERFKPLMKEVEDEHWDLGTLFETKDDDDDKDTTRNDDDERIHDDDVIDDYYGGGPIYKKSASDTGDKPKKALAGAHVGGGAGGSHAHHQHHKKQQAILPGVFFVYQIYPFAIEVTKEVVPFTHLLIRIMATVGGVFTIFGWLDAVLYSRERKKGGNGYGK